MKETLTLRSSRSWGTGVEEWVEAKDLSEILPEGFPIRKTVFGNGAGVIGLAFGHVDNEVVDPQTVDELYYGFSEYFFKLSHQNHLV